VDARTEIRDFLTSRRAKLTPEEIGLTAYGPRQVPGLRREEVAVIAGVSVDYYNRMERGNLAGASEGVLEAVAGALRLDEAERECVAALRTQAGRDPFDGDLADLVGELSTQSEEFAALWATHNVRLHRAAEKRFNHPIVGGLTLRYDRLAVAADPGLEIFAYMAEPGSRSAEALNLLASWAADPSALPGRASARTDARAVR
jgi:transcriptional regulator with XRE-family HTH domain